MIENEKDHNLNGQISNEVDYGVSLIESIINDDNPMSNFSETIEEISIESLKELAKTIVSMKQNLFLDLKDDLNDENKEQIKVNFIKKALENIDKILSVTDNKDFEKNIPLEKRLYHIHQRITNLPPPALSREVLKPDEYQHVLSESKKFGIPSSRIQYLETKLEYYVSLHEKDIEWFNQQRNQIECQQDQIYELQEMIFNEKNDNIQSAIFHFPPGYFRIEFTNLPLSLSNSLNTLHKRYIHHENSGLYRTKALFLQTQLFHLNSYQ